MFIFILHLAFFYYPFRQYEQREMRFHEEMQEQLKKFDNELDRLRNELEYLRSEDKRCNRSLSKFLFKKYF